MATNIYPNSKSYYHYGVLKNQENEIMDHQMMHIIVEIAKFDKKAAEVKTDLDKLIYLMKNIQDIPGIKDLPKFLTEDWVEQAIEKVDQSKMTAEQKMFFEMTLARNGSIIAMREEEREQDRAEIRKALKEEVRDEVKEEVRVKEKEIAKKLKMKGLSNEEIAELTELSISEIEML